MSQLLIKGHNGARFRLNITQFRSPMSASINSVQVRRMMHHFPIRAGQPDIQFTAQFRSIDEKHDFQNFVREHQRNALEDNYNTNRSSKGAVTLLWPERNVDNWTGYIVSMPVQEIRFVYAPRVTFGVSLVDSMLSQRSFNFSLGSDWMTIVGDTLGSYISGDPNAVDNLIQPPNSQRIIGERLDRSRDAINQYLGTRRLS